MGLPDIASPLGVYLPPRDMNASRRLGGRARRLGRLCTPSTPKKPSSRWGTKARLARLPSRGARLSDGMSHALDARDRCLREFAMRAVRYAPRVSDPIRRFVQKAESDRRCHERAGLWLLCSVHDETEFFLGRSEVHSTGRGGIETRQGWRANPPPRVRARRKRTAISPRAR